MAPAVADRPIAEAAPTTGLTREEVRSLVDRQARRYLGISGEEFRRRWDRGEYADDPDRAGLIRLAFLLPFAD
jgi:hypothetical protein